MASFFHGVTPSASGGQFAQVYVFKKQGVPLSDSASVLWMDFIVYQSTMIASVFILILLRFHHFYTNYSQFFLLVLLGFLVNSLVIDVYKRQTVSSADSARSSARMRPSVRSY